MYYIIIFTAPTLKTVIEELNDVVCKSNAIGIQLGVPFSKLKSFEFEALSNDEKFTSIVDYWLRDNTNVKVTWNSIVAVLKSVSVDEVVLANRIHKKFCQPEESLGIISERAKRASSVTVHAPLK